MKRLFILLFCILALNSCFYRSISTDGNTVSGFGNIDTEIDVTVFGTVSDARTGNFLNNVAISEENGRGGVTVTGADGYYELSFKASYLNNVRIKAEKKNYSTKWYTINMTDYKNQKEKKCTIKVDFMLD